MDGDKGLNTGGMGTFSHALTNWHEIVLLMGIKMATDGVGIILHIGRSRNCSVVEHAKFQNAELSGLTNIPIMQSDLYGKE